MNDYWVQAYSNLYHGKKILLGVSGSIAAFKAIDIIRIIKKCGAEVKVILTDSAEQFVSPLTIETLSENPAYTSMWKKIGPQGTTMNHIDLARWADLILIAPATANTIAELAHGLARNLLTTEVLASLAPVYIAPAMNPSMYSHPATQENLNKLKSIGYQILYAEHGITACGDEGIGRMAEPESIIESMSRSLCGKARGKTVLISLGATRSYLDPVRFLTNRSSGKMGAALAFAALQEGYHVEVIAGPTQVTLPKLAKITRVTTTNEMAGAVMEAFPKADYFLSTAAVLDFEFSSFSSEKLKKDSMNADTQLLPTVDILKTVGESKKKNQFILGFAAESQNLTANAKKKLKSKNCDAVFVNPIKEESSGFESDQNRGYLVTRKKSKSFKLQDKHTLARAILREIRMIK